ncbi:MAG TPA: Nif3-like dinuclear metal center hexameric protein [Melioribacteraceae bacterium]|nr:Nif3-like dinuclear metal center hexameric protein [Melioribacteraceae bacterium]
MMINDLIKYYENRVPKGMSWEKDNVGLQIGSLNKPFKNILVCLELTSDSLQFAINNNCNLIFTHHPFLFTPLKNINTDKDSGKIISLAIKNDITVYSSHTNLDFVKGGVSFELAKRLKLQNLKFLSNFEKNQYKISVFVPESYVEIVSKGIFEAGGGIIGDYENCSYRVKGEGTFKGNENTNPTIGTKQILEKVDEIKLEIIVNRWDLNKVIYSLKQTHPYEEPAYDIIPLENKNENHGAGVIGTLLQPINLNSFFELIKSELNLDGFRYTVGKDKPIERVAVCGGSGSDLLNEAILQKADAFITADIKYHTFHDAKGKITLIDAGHYETEIFGLNTIKNIIYNYFDEYSINTEVFEYFDTNPIKFYYNIGEK